MGQTFSPTATTMFPLTTSVVCGVLACGDTKVVPDSFNPGSVTVTRGTHDKNGVPHRSLRGPSLHVHELRRQHAALRVAGYHHGQSARRLRVGRLCSRRLHTGRRNDGSRVAEPETGLRLPTIPSSSREAILGIPTALDCLIPGFAGSATEPWPTAIIAGGHLAHDQWRRGSSSWPRSRLSSLTASIRRKTERMTAVYPPTSTVGGRPTM